MNQRSPEAVRLMQLARSEDEPNVQVLSRVEASLSHRIAHGVTVVAAGTFATKAAVGASLLATWAKVGALLGITVAAAGAGWWVANPLLRASQQNRNVASGVPRSVVLSGSIAHSETTAATEPASSTTSPAASDTSQAKPRSFLPVGTVAAADAPDPLHAEIRDLRDAQQALRAGQATRVLSLLDLQDAKYPGGMMQEERSAARVLALCQSGRVSEARTAADRFERRWPKSPLVARVRSSCSKP